MKFFIPLIFLPVFLVWLLYRILIKKDLNKHKDELMFGSIFIVIWVVLYYWITHVK